MTGRSAIGSTDNAESGSATTRRKWALQSGRGGTTLPQRQSGCVGLLSQLPRRGFSLEDFAERALRAGSHYDAGPPVWHGDGQDPGDRDGTRFAGKISGADPAGDEECAHRGERAGRERGLPVAASAGRHSFERDHPAGGRAAGAVWGCGPAEEPDRFGSGSSGAVRDFSEGARFSGEDTGEHDSGRPGGAGEGREDFEIEEETEGTEAAGDGAQGRR